MLLGMCVKKLLWKILGAKLVQSACVIMLFYKDNGESDIFSCPVICFSLFLSFKTANKAVLFLLLGFV